MINKTDLYKTSGVGLFRSAVSYRVAENVLSYIYIYIYGGTALSGPGFLIIEASRSHSDTLRSVGLLCTSVQPDVET